MRLKIAVLDIEFNKKNRVTVAQFASKEAIANTPRSPRFEVSQLINTKSPDATSKFGSTTTSKRTANQSSTGLSQPVGYAMKNSSYSTIISQPDDLVKGKFKNIRAIF
jgi:hypothetical protein